MNQITLAPPLFSLSQFCDKAIWEKRGRKKEGKKIGNPIWTKKNIVTSWWSSATPTFCSQLWHLCARPILATSQHSASEVSLRYFKMIFVSPVSIILYLRMEGGQILVDTSIGNIGRVVPILCFIRASN